MRKLRTDKIGIINKAIHEKEPLDRVGCCRPYIWLWTACLSKQRGKPESGGAGEQMHNLFMESYYIAHDVSVLPASGYGSWLKRSQKASWKWGHSPRVSFYLNLLQLTSIPRKQVSYIILKLMMPSD